VSGQPSFKCSSVPTIRLDDGAGALAALTPEAGARLRRKAWKHIRRVNPSAVRKAQQLARTR
jgi:hypothetical protein